MDRAEFLSKLKTQQGKVEGMIAQLEKLYLEETIPFGNIFKGWEFYVNLKRNQDSLAQKKNFKITNKNRVYSLSSAQSQISKQLSKDDANSDPGFQTKTENKECRKRGELSDDSFTVNNNGNLRTQKKKKIL